MTEPTESSNTGFWSGGGDRSAHQSCRALVETVDGGVFRLDEDERFVAVDETLLEITDYAREELENAEISALLTTADVERFRSAVATQRRPETTDATTLELSLRSATDQPIPCKLRVTAFQTAEGATETVGIVRASESAESPTPSPESSIPSVEPTQTALEEAEVGVFVLDDEFDVAWINGATERYFGIDRTDVLGRDKRQLIKETIQHRLEAPAAFAETVTATYDDNSYVERFECHVVADGDRTERWLEHRSKPIESGPYAGGRIELYYDVTDQHRRAYQLRRLNEAVREWLTSETETAVAERATHHLRDILDLEINGVFRYEPAATELQPLAWSDPADELFGELPTFAAGEGIAWRVFETGEPEIYTDVKTDPAVYNPDTPIHSEICLPIGDHGVLLIGSETRSAFDEGDLSLAKIVASSLEATFDRLHREHQLERERAQTEKLLRTAPVAVSVTDADGEPLLLNRHARTLLGGEPIETLANADEWTVTDHNGTPLDPQRAPASRVRETGNGVIGTELSLEGPTGERTDLSVNAAPISDTDGSLERVITVGEDITARKASERQLERRKSELETELSEVFGRISDAFYALDESWRFTHVNERAETLLGRSRDDLVGEVIWEAFPHGTESDLQEQLEAAMERQEAISWERYSETLGLWMEIQAYPSETGLSVYFKDITDRKRREHQLMQYERIIETVEDGIYVIDDDGRFITVNDAYAELTGYSRDELLGSHASLVADESAIGSAREVVTDNRADSTVETTLEAEDGTHVPVEATVTTIAPPVGAKSPTESVTGTGSPERDSDRSPSEEGYARVGVVRDVTERKERQQRLEESEQRYRTLAENFPNGVVALFDDELRYTAAGGQLLDELGIDREAATGETIFDRYPDDIADAVEPNFRAALEGEESRFELTYLGRELLAYTLPVRTTGTAPQGMLVVQDVTERKAYERKLEASNERLEQFAYAASHDLQEPLRMVASYLTLIDNRYGDELDEDGTEFLAYAVDGAERMKGMIDGLLAYSRIETQGNELEPVALEDVFAAVCEDLSLRIDEHDAEITAEPLPRVRGDPDQLRQVFQNLLSNAIQYSGDDPPRIHVSAERDGSQWIISVRDEGIGMEPDDTDQIFDVFERLHSHDEQSGAGIGLALCSRIVERHGGDIWVDSTPGDGSTFSMTLPAVETAD